MMIKQEGQITVPHEIRQALGVQPGDKLLFEEDRSGIRVRPVRAKSPFEKYRGSGTPAFREARRPSCAGFVNCGADGQAALSSRVRANRYGDRLRLLRIPYSIRERLNAEHEVS